MGVFFPIVFRLSHERQAAFGVALLADRQLPGFGQLFQGIAAGGVQQAIAHLFIADLYIEQRFGDQLADRHQHLFGRDMLADDHRGGRGQVETAHEHRQPPQAGLFAGREQREAPVQRGAQCLLARCGVGVVVKQGDAVLQLPVKLLQGETADLRGSQLDGQGNAVQPLADVDHQRHLAVAQFEVVTAGHRPFGKQLQRRVFQGGVALDGHFPGRERQGVQALHVFAFGAQAFAAGGQDVQVGCAAQRGFR
nr:hypothetical protein GCM10020185_64620 [Pseudomonas brassicacearum subsp. brassicacearum]